jgi:DNA-binding NarL/FixJ family response regulator
MTRLVALPDAESAGGALPAASRVDRPSVRSTRSTALTVALFGDCELVARGLDQMLAPVSARVRIHHPGAGAGASPSGSLSPDVILFDCYPSRVHEGVMRALPAPPAAGGSRVVAYSWETRGDLVAAALQHGYRGYIAKSLPARRLVEALERIGRGDPVVCVPPDAADPADPAAVDVKWSREEAGLTQREADVLDLIAAGRSNAEIAAALTVSINSVKSYVRSSYRKIGATSRSQAVLWGISQGLGASER